MPPRLFCASLLLLGLAAGCGLSGGARARQHLAAERAALATRPVRVGTIALVDASGSFVLIDGAGFPPPTAGAKLGSFEGSLATGELRATGIQRQPFLVADVLSGTPHKGEAVLQSRETPLPVAASQPAAAPSPPAPAAARRPAWKRWLLPFAK